MECTQCGACCIAPDIAALDKPLGQRCPHLTPALLCGIYEQRPAICRSYQADAFCEEIAAPTIEARVHNFLSAFGLVEEAAAVARAVAAGPATLRSLRPLPVLQKAREKGSP
jgi:Fe-S-cluster containining protein